MADRTWTLKLNEYQRNNLLWLINACGYGHDGVPPFTLANTGDWIGEIAWMLEHEKDGSICLEDGEQANKTLEELEREVADWARVAQVMES